MFYLLLFVQELLVIFCLGVNILSRLAKSEGCDVNIREHPFPCISFIGNIPLLKALRVNY